ncbi:MAG: hypothetical protein JST17_00010 [Bacteroidetes bacterium]|nr:hypothetical protein [Bacteroidota bacterium]MBS1932058.1 hypothetical protein [Bacteroidota bacterium]
MKNKIVFILFMSFLQYSCKEESNNANRSIESQNTDSSLNVLMKKFELSDPATFKSDSNSLVFYCTRSFDTSFLLHLKKEQDGINGIYYEVLPSYHNNVNDVIIGENHLLFFEGYNFTIDSSEWQIIKSKTVDLLNDTSFKNNPGCRDCIEYGLSYNLKSKTDNGTKYAPFYKFLKVLFLEKFIQERKPFANREKIN